MVICVESVARIQWSVMLSEWFEMITSTRIKYGLNSKIEFAFYVLVGTRLKEKKHHYFYAKASSDLHSLVQAVLNSKTKKRHAMHFVANHPHYVCIPLHKYRFNSRTTFWN